MGQKSNFVIADTSSTDPMANIGKITMWPAGEPYTAMVLNNKSAIALNKSPAAAATPSSP